MTIFSTPDKWHISYEARVHGRRLEPGTEVTISGIKGRCRFVRHVVTPCGYEWLDFMSDRGTRSVRISRAMVVHRIRKERQS